MIKNVIFLTSKKQFPKVEIETIKTCSEFHFHGKFSLPRVFLSSSGLFWSSILLFSDGEVFRLSKQRWNEPDTTDAYFYNLGNKQLRTRNIQKQAYFSDHRQYDKWILMSLRNKKKLL